jgi:predicted XRE-type DNA-binding protein
VHGVAIRKSGNQAKAQAAKALTSKRETVESSTGNVFADLGLPDAEELLLISQVAISIAELVEQRGWTEIDIARRAGIDQSKASNLLRGRLVRVFWRTPFRHAQPTRA